MSKPDLVVVGDVPNNKFINHVDIRGGYCPRNGNNVVVFGSPKMICEHAFVFCFATPKATTNSSLWIIKRHLPLAIQDVEAVLP